MSKNFYITTPIYYASGRLHLGSASSTCFCDSYSRYMKQLGYDSRFMTGLDEHGQKVEKKAEERNLTPQDYTDKLAERAINLWKYLKCDYDKFIRTTDESHVKQVQQIFDMMLKNDDIYLGEYDGWYCVSCETFFTNSEVGEEHICPSCGKKVTTVKEKSYFFRLSKYQDRLLKFIEDNPDFIKPEGKKNEVVSFIKGGLEDLSVSRSTFKWGIPLLNDPKHVVYVWLDALFNYLTGLNFLEEDKSLYEKYWLNGKTVHVVAKDILRFHAIFWPIFLMSINVPVNYQLFCHSWFLMMGEKMSKSTGNVIYPETFVKKYGLDSFRYYVLRNFPYAQDAVCTPLDYIQTYNTELVNDFGNLVSRTLSMANKYFGSKVRNIRSDNEYIVSFEKFFSEEVENYHKDMAEYKINNALKDINNIVSRTNKLIDETMPWALYKEGNMELLESVIYHLLDAIRMESILYVPYLIDSTEVIFNVLNVNDDEKDLTNLKPFTKEVYETSMLEKALFPRENDPEKAKEEILVDMEEELKKDI
ncbi:MAG: methionine--tRNA ligase [Gammaproteobacteria bacterium]|nr:methionine--tRNA ligase [Gammaproteobacteria bacterium]